MNVALVAEFLLVVLVADLLLGVMGAVLLVLGIAFAPKPLGAWCKAVFRGGDYTVAAVFGGDGKHSVSAYCGRWQQQLLTGSLDSRIEQLIALVFGGIVRAIIDRIFGDGHCIGAAQREGLLA